MSPSPTKSFRAVLEQSGDKLRWIIARVPFDLAKAWPLRNGRRVRGEINGFAFRTSLFPNARRGARAACEQDDASGGARQGGRHGADPAGARYGTAGGIRSHGVDG